MLAIGDRVKAALEKRLAVVMEADMRRAAADAMPYVSSVLQNTIAKAIPQIKNQTSFSDGLYSEHPTRRHYWGVIERLCAEIPTPATDAKPSKI